MIKSFKKHHCILKIRAKLFHIVSGCKLSLLKTDPLGKKQVFFLIVSRGNITVSLINEFTDVEDRSGCILTLRRYTKPREWAVDQRTKDFKRNYLKLSFQIGSKFIFYEKLVWYVFSKNRILNESLVNLNILLFSSKKNQF